MEQKNELQLKMKRAEMVMQLGEFYYKKLRETGEVVEAQIQEITNGIGQIDLEIARVTGAWMSEEGKCPNCGGELQEQSAFCPNCGYSMKEYFQQFIGNCNRCGAKIKIGQNFCDICGVKLIDMSAVANSSTSESEGMQ